MPDTALDPGETSVNKTRSLPTVLMVYRATESSNQATTTVTSTRIQKYRELWEHRGGASVVDGWKWLCHLESLNPKGELMTASQSRGKSILGREANICEGPE